jgi:hypothetical protein
MKKYRVGEWRSKFALILVRSALLAGNEGERKNDQKKSEKYFHASQVGTENTGFLINNP